MTTSVLEDVFGHHVWATVQLIDACVPLSSEQLANTVPGIYGTITRTMQHLVGSDSWYLYLITDRGILRIDEDRMDLVLKAAMQQDGVLLSRVLAGDVDPDTLVTEAEDGDGYETDAVTGIRLAQALHNGSDHRSQICTALTALGVEPPGIDAWNYGFQNGRVVERSRGPG